MGIASVVVNIVLDLILVPPFGIVGPGFATFGESLVGSGVLAWVILGRGATLRLAAVCAPVVVTTMLFAVDPDSIPLAAVTILAAVLTGLWALSAERRSAFRT